jgi:hypothetical protein
MLSPKSLPQQNHLPCPCSAIPMASYEDEDEEAFTAGDARLAAPPDRAPSNDALFHTTVPMLALMRIAF